VQCRTGWGTEVVSVLDMKVGSVGVTGGVWVCVGHAGVGLEVGTAVDEEGVWGGVY